MDWSSIALEYLFLGVMTLVVFVLIIKDLPKDKVVSLIFMIVVILFWPFFAAVALYTVVVEL